MKRTQLGALARMDAALDHCNIQGCSVLRSEVRQRVHITSQVSESVGQRGGLFLPAHYLNLPPLSVLDDLLVCVGMGVYPMAARSA